MFTCLLSFSLQPCSLMREPAVLSTTVRHRSICFTDLSLVRAHSFIKMDTRKILVHVKHAGMFSARLYLITRLLYQVMIMFSSYLHRKNNKNVFCKMDTMGSIVIERISSSLWKSHKQDSDCSENTVPMLKPH